MVSEVHYEVGILDRVDHATGDLSYVHCLVDQLLRSFAVASY